MKIRELRLQTHCLGELKTFYAKILKLPLVYESGKRFTVRVGRSKLTFSRSDKDSEPYYFFKVMAKSQCFADTIRHLKEVADVQEEFESTIQEKVAYFKDPAGNTVGCRAGITAKAISKFVSIPEALVGICEIVHAVENTTIFCEYLLQQLHLSVGQHKDFYSVILGDPNGAIVVTQINRTLLDGQKPVKNFPLALDLF
jgi:catechol-2,3-dioxygenase